MTLAYCLLGLFFLWLTYNLYYPIYRHPQGIVISFLLGWLVGELPWHVIAIGLLLNLVFIAFDTVHGVWGLLGFAAFVASWAGLVWHQHVADQSGARLAKLLTQELGPDFRPQNIPPFSRAKLLHPFALHLKPHQQVGVELIRNIVYAEVDGMRLKLDIRRPEELSQEADLIENNAPVLFQIHGGAWTYGYGSKNEQGLPLMNKMAQRGWVCVSIDYRLSPHASFPDHIIDCKRALVWVKQHIAEYGGNPDFIIATGGSAGGHLSSLLALSANHAALQPGFESEDTGVQGCVPFYGIYDFTDRHRLQRHSELQRILEESILKVNQKDHPELYRLASPLEHISENAPPFLVIQGNRDTLVSDREARMFSVELSRVSRQPAIYAEIDLAQHAFEIFPSVRTERVLDQVAAFLDYLAFHKA